MTNKDHIRRIWLMSNDFTLDKDERASLTWALAELKQAEADKVAKAWENPYTRAIATLEAASRSFEGSYG